MWLHVLRYGLAQMCFFVMNLLPLVGGGRMVVGMLSTGLIQIVFQNNDKFIQQETKNNISMELLYLYIPYLL